jgi:membrane-bound metal-dependent hydrolase YbcI (DUF457 family)
MPFTPFHFGVGLAAKAAVPRHFHLGFFIALQIIIDVESLYNLAYHRYPVHRFLHTFLGATLLALLSSALALPLVLRWGTKARGCPRSAGLLFASLLATALFATWSHVVLDGIMHRDARPLWPMSDLNPLLHLIGVGALHLACSVMGFFGLIALAFRWSLRDHDA